MVAARALFHAPDLGLGLVTVPGLHGLAVAGDRVCDIQTAGGAPGHVPQGHGLSDERGGRGLGDDGFIGLIGLIGLPGHRLGRVRVGQLPDRAGTGRAGALSHVAVRVGRAAFSPEHGGGTVAHEGQDPAVAGGAEVNGLIGRGAVGIR